MAVRFVLDASVLVPLFPVDAPSDRSEAWLSKHSDGLIASDFACAETSSAIARKFRSGLLTREEAGAAFERVELWALFSTERVNITSADIQWAQKRIWMLGPPIRTPDAIHLSVAWRHGAAIVTFDRQLAAAARTLNVLLADDA